LSHLSEARPLNAVARSATLTLAAISAQRQNAMLGRQMIQTPSQSREAAAWQRRRLMF